MAHVIGNRKRILIYGFAPFASYRTNVSAEVVRSLAARPRLYRKIFPVSFNRSMFLRELEKIRPMVVIGLGQHPRARKLRIECAARNARRGFGERRERRIDPSGVPKKFCSLRMPRMSSCTRTYNAGSYVCNFSMWVMLAWCEKHGARFGFVHVPIGFNTRRGVRYLEQVLKRLPR